MSTSTSSRGRLAPAPGDVLSEVSIVCGLAGRLLRGRPVVPWASFERDYARIRERSAGSSRVASGYAERVGEGFVLPHPPRDSCDLLDAGRPGALQVKRSR